MRNRQSEKEGERKRGKEESVRGNNKKERKGRKEED